MPPKDTIVELRDGGRVRAALVLEDSGKGLRLLHADGHELRVPASRVVNDTGGTLPSGTAAADRPAALRKFEAEAASLALTVDLSGLHGTCLAEGASDLPLSDLAGLALGTESALAVSAIHRALAEPNAFFRFDGRRFLALTATERAAEEERLARSRRLEEERAAFLAAAGARLSGGQTRLPEGSAKFLRALREFAVEGDAAHSKKEAVGLARELGASTAEAPVDPARAFDLLVQLGEFHRDENLPLLKAGVRVEFPAEVLAEAEELSRSPLDERSRRDLRHLEVVTIDDAETTEIDDGLSFERRGTEMVIGIHVADAAAFVPPGTLVDEEAFSRGTSYYLPELHVPMLPAVLAENAASLVAGVDRPGISYLVTLTPHGEILRTEVVLSILRIRQRLTYDDCEAFLAGEDTGPAWLSDVAVIAAACEQRRTSEGAIAIRAPEIKITFDPDGEPIITLLDPGRPARRLVSEMMILANSVAAEFCRTRGLPAIYRRQSPPEPGIPLPPADVYDPVAVARFRRALSRTEVSLEPGPHAGLGLPSYLQATSPIRRYQDLAVHRLMAASLRGDPLPHSRQEMQVIAAATEQAGRQARGIEGETDEYWVLRALERRIGDTVPALIVRLDDRRTLVEITEHARSFPIAKRPDHVLGAAVRLRVRSVRPRQGAITFEQVSP